MDPAALRALLSAARAEGDAQGTDPQFREADLRGAFLMRADLAGEKLAGALFDHANLAGARLGGADLSQSSLRNVELNGADLTGADLRDADLSEARVEGTCLANADLRGACLALLRGYPGDVTGMRLDHEGCRRSELGDVTLIQLWRDGAILEHLERFSDRVRRACLVRAEAAPMPAWQAGSEVLGVRLLERMGGGPHGSVWTAKDSDGKTVAVKRFEASSGSGDAATFRRAVGILNRAASADEAERSPLARPIAVSLDGLAFSVPYYDNGSAVGIPSLGWSVERTLEFFRHVCRRIRELHELGMTHRALKPSNVLVDDELEPVLMDAGMLPLGASSTPPSGPDAIYRAPEELGGTSTQSPTADVYGLGRLLWFLLLGRDPDEPYAAFAKLTALASCPVGIARIIRKATAHDPAVRYQWIEELESDLTRYEQAELVGILPGSGDEPRPRYGVSSLPAPRRPAKASPGPRPAKVETAAERSDAGWGSSLRLAGWFGLLTTALASVLLLATPVPSPASASLYGIVVTLGLALGTLLGPSHPERPWLSRFAFFAAALAALSFLELDRLVIVRWRLTLEQGTDHARPAAARYLARRGARDLSGARLAHADLWRADFGRADLTGADLTKARLVETNLAEANLRGAKLHGADLSGADLFASNAYEANGWLETRCNRLTAMPKQWACTDGRPSGR